MIFSFSGPWVRIRAGKPNQVEIQSVPVSFSSSPWTQSCSVSSPLVSDHCLHCIQVHSCFHDPKQQLFFPFLRESIPWSDILRNLTFIHLPDFPLLSHLSEPFPVAQPLCHMYLSLKRDHELPWERQNFLESQLVSFEMPWVPSFTPAPSSEMSFVCEFVTSASSTWWSGIS